MTNLQNALWSFQRDAVAKALRHTGFLLWAPTGTGKTAMSLAIAERRFRRGQVSRVMVICPLSLKQQWIDDIRRWLPYAHIADDPLAVPPENELWFYVCNYEWIRGDQQLRTLRKKPYDMIIADELHKLKSRSSKQSRRIWLIGKSVMYRVGLTGSPIESDELDLWAQVRFLNDQVFGHSYTDFKTEWTRPAGFMGKSQKLRSHLVKHYLERVADISYTIEKSDALDLPPVVHKHIPVIMSGKQRRAYDDLERDMVVTIGDAVIATPLAITQMIRLQQLTGGYITGPDRDPIVVGTAKLDVLRDVLDGHRQPIVIFARFDWEIQQIAALARSMRRVVTVITGKINDGSRKKFDVLVCQVAVMAGLDGMQHVASTGVFFSKTFSRIHYEQATGRLDRSGQSAERVTFIHLDAKNTIDDDLANAIKAKGDVARNILGFFRRRHAR